MESWFKWKHIFSQADHDSSYACIDCTCNILSCTLLMSSDLQIASCSRLIGEENHNADN